MSARPSITTAPFAAVLGYILGVLNLALGHVAKLPRGEARLALLKALLDAAQAADARRTAAVLVQHLALNERDRVFGAGLKTYAAIRGAAETLVLEEEHAEDMTDLLALCLAPSHMTPPEALRHFEGLAAAVESRAAAFASESVDAAMVATLRAQSQALSEASERLSAAIHQRGAASADLKKARGDLLAHLRLVERSIKKNLSDSERAALASLRAQFFPRYPAKDAKDAKPAEPAG